MEGKRVSSVSQMRAGQIIGACLAFVGVVLSVLGMHGCKLHSKSGNGLCSKQRVWYAWALTWVAGQLVQFFAVHFATQSVVAAVTTGGIFVNSFSANRQFGEQFTACDLISTSGVVGGKHLPHLIPSQASPSRPRSRQAHPPSQQAAPCWSSSRLQFSRRSTLPCPK